MVIVRPLPFPRRMMPPQQSVANLSLVVQQSLRAGNGVPDSSPLPELWLEAYKYRQLTALEMIRMVPRANDSVGEYITHVSLAVPVVLTEARRRQLLQTALLRRVLVHDRSLYSASNAIPRALLRRHSAFMADAESRRLAMQTNCDPTHNVTSLYIIPIESRVNLRLRAPFGIVWADRNRSASISALDPYQGGESVQLTRSDAQKQIAARITQLKDGHIDPDEDDREWAEQYPELDAEAEAMETGAPPAAPGLAAAVSTMTTDDSFDICAGLPPVEALVEASACDYVQSELSTPSATGIYSIRYYTPANSNIMVRHRCNV